MSALVLAALGCGLPSLPGVGPGTGGTSGGSQTGDFSDKSADANVSGTSFAAAVVLGSFSPQTALSASGQTQITATSAFGVAHCPGMGIQFLGKPEAGKSYDAAVGAGFGDGKALITLSEGMGCETTLKQWSATGGALKIDSVSGQAVNYSFDLVMSPSSDGSSTTSAGGTFKLKGSGKVDKMSGL